MVLYKYYPCNEYTFKALSELGLWCSPASNMNDPFDCLSLLDVSFDESEVNNLKSDIFEELNQYFMTQTFVEKMREQVKMEREVLGLFSFCSLSATYTNKLMWSHYADSHSGIVIGLDISSKLLERSILLHKIVYSDTVTNFPIIEFRQSANDHIKRMGLLFKYLSVKTSDWHYEEEYRLWRSKNSGYFKYDLVDLKSVYFGLNCSRETRTLVKAILRGHGVKDDVYYDMYTDIDPVITLKAMKHIIK